ncbi:VOC family protein [Polluticaenibacter yanchengensis]|uniref:VOC family protein n=1 Tax=Polluticaenibacter yanchengensis TaxID=3014562 RepID=A0ABT4ULM0_9BACT|nr:VOC family protein [Chitinophagaceae bacterium LY-5]
MNPFCWIEIYVEDMPRAVKFYEEVLQVKLTPMPAPDEVSGMQMSAFPSQYPGDNASGALVKMDGFGPGGSGTIAYFSCEDCAVEIGRVAAAGGKVYQEKFSISEHGFIGICGDSEGNTIGFHSLK